MFLKIAKWKQYFKYTSGVNAQVSYVHLSIPLLKKMTAKASHRLAPAGFILKSRTNLKIKIT